MLVSQQSKTIRNGKKERTEIFCINNFIQTDRIKSRSATSQFLSLAINITTFVLLSTYPHERSFLIGYRRAAVRNCSPKLLGRLIRKGKLKQDSCFTVTGGRSIFSIRLCVYWRHLELNNLFPEPGDPMITLFQKHSFPFLKRRNCITGITNLK